MENKRYLRPSSVISYHEFLQDHSNLPLDFIVNKSQILKDGLSRGTAIHSAIEQYVLNGSKDPMYASLYHEVDMFLAGIADYEKKYEFNMKDVELFGEVNFTGTCDLLAINHEKKQILIVDWKTNKAMSEKSKSGYKFQILIYALMAQKHLNLPDYKISGCLAWYAPAGKMYSYRLNFTPKNLIDCNDICTAVWNNLDYISSQKKTLIENNEKVASLITEKHNEKIAKIKEIKEKIIEAKDYIVFLEEELKNLGLNEIETDIDQITQKSPYNFVVNNITFSAQYKETVDYQKVGLYMFEALNIDFKQIIKDAGAKRQYLSKSIEINNVE